MLIHDKEFLQDIKALLTYFSEAGIYTYADEDGEIIEITDMAKDMLKIIHDRTS